MTAASIDNGAGPVALSAETATAGSAAAELKPNADAGEGDMTMELDYTIEEAGAYPRCC